VGGRRAYQVARGGDKPVIAPRRVTIHALELVEWDTSDAARPVAVLDVRCSAGTYVRALARDLGERLGSGAYLAALTRTRSGAFGLEDAHPLDKVREEAAAGRIETLLLPPDAGLDLPRLTLRGRDLEALSRGQVVSARGALPADLEDGAVTRVVDDADRLVAMAHLRSGRLHPDKVFTPAGR
jgi:tRNA pseudouridine55 synthase